VLEGTSWRATLVDGETPMVDNPVTLQFEPGRIGGRTGCNDYGADVRVENGRLVVGGVTTTMAACVDELPSRIEGVWLAILEGDPILVSDGARLMLRSEAGEAILEPGPPVR
jgi:heat shock protein HslJ